jgi:DNA-binding MarR family transcriptional regulator
VTAERNISPGSVDDEDAPLTLYLVKRLEMVIRSVMDDALRPFGLTALQYTALTVLQRRSPLSSAQLARRSFVRPQSMHTMVLMLEERGLIEREEDPDNRRVLLAGLTDRGRSLLAECAPPVEELEQRLLTGMDAHRRAEFRRDLDHGHAMLASHAKEASVSELDH